MAWTCGAFLGGAAAFLCVGCGSVEGAGDLQGRGPVVVVDAISAAVCRLVGGVFGLIVGVPAGELLGPCFVGGAPLFRGAALVDLGERPLGAGDRGGGLVRRGHTDHVLGVLLRFGRGLL